MVITALRGVFAGFGAFLWVMLWYDRSPWLGISQGLIVSVLLWRELRLEFRRQ
jgi:hypothetical protein